MILGRLGGLCAAIGLAAGLAGCVEDYGYGGIGVGYGAGYYGDPYYDGYGYAPSYYGWYGDYFYPGAGVYVYDRYRRPFRWNGSQQRYWADRQRFRGRDWNGSGNWNGFDRGVRPVPGAGADRRWQPGSGNPGRRFEGVRGRPGGADGGNVGRRFEGLDGRPGGFDGRPGAGAPGNRPGAGIRREGPRPGASSIRQRDTR